jgi:hypothetical protein
MRHSLVLLMLLGALGCERIVGVDDLKIVRQAEGAAGAAGAAGGAGAPSCTADATPCGACIERSCCAPALDCSGDATCSACLDAPLQPGCSANGKLLAYQACAQQSCPECSGP